MKVVNFFKNKKYLAIYLVGVLLLSTGLSYAYFVATSRVEGGGSMGTATTATIESSGIIANGNINVSEVDIYPGHKTISSIEVVGTGDNEPISFNVIFNGTNTFETDINYKVYRTTTNISASYNCTKEQSVVDGTLRYYETCNGTNINELGEVISSGTITQSSTDAKTILVSDEVLLTTTDGNRVYYYVEIEYPNNEENQNSDMDSLINGSITVEKSSNEYTSPSVLFTTTTTAGSNNWYKSVSITSNITSYTNNHEVLYCVTTNDTCTPNTSATLSNNSFTTTLSDNANSQRLCISITDEYGITGEGCSERYLVDGTNPSLSITNTEVSTDSITITVNGSDSHSGIAEYRFSSNGGSSYETVNTSNNSYSYTFNNLESGTTYNLSIQAVDEAGNITTVTSSAETEVDGLTVNGLLANYPTVLTRTSFSSTVTNTTTGTIYKSADSSQYDEDGEVYYFAGNPTDNWISFAGFYWRIIRINGDGSIRLIYNGTSTATTGTGTQIGTSAFNTERGDNMYVGYMYTSGEVHGLGTSSTIKGVLDNWYLTNIQNAGYSSYIDTNAGFCGDRTPSSGTGTGTTYTEYAAINRLNYNKNPLYKCSNSTDLFTLNDSNQGNKALTYPIGLITADEVAYAGGVYGTRNIGYYLFTNQFYWTISPSFFSGSDASVFNVGDIGSFGNGYVYDPWGVRPVINLKADTLFELGGTGTSTNPYVVV